MNPSIGDARSSELSKHLRKSATEVDDLRRTRILQMLPHTLFISHTSLDDAFIKNSTIGSRLPERGSIWWTCGDFFPDPFYHSLTTGGANSYERIVGLSLLASVRVLVVWSQNAVKSDYVRAEVLIALEENKKLAAYLLPDAPPFPFKVPQVADNESLRSLLQSWN